MQNLNFKGYYAIPISKTQGPNTKSFNLMISESAPIVDKSEEQHFSPEKQVYYLPIQDKNEKLFEQLAKVYYINVKKTEKADIENDTIKFKNEDSPAQKINDFVMSAIVLGAKHDIKNNDGVKKITLFEDDGKTVYGIFKYSNGLLKEKQTFLDGKLAHITTFKDDGSFNYTRFPYSDDFGKVKTQGDIIINNKRIKAEADNTQKG